MAKKHASLVGEAQNPDGTVTLYPTEPLGDVRVPNVPAIEMDVSPERAAALLAYQPPAFSLKPAKPLAESKED